MEFVLKVFSIFTRKQKWYCASLFACMFAGAALEAIGISAILPLITIMGNPGFLTKYTAVQKISLSFGIQTHVQLIIAIASILIFLYILKNVFMAWVTKKQVKFSLDNQVFFATQLMATYLGRPYTFHLEENTAVLIRNISSSVPSVFAGVIVSIFMLLTEFLTAFVIWLMIIFVDAFTAIIVAGLLGILVYSILRTVRKRIALQGKRQTDCSALYTKWLNQSLGAIKEVKVLGKEAYFLEEFKDAYIKYGNANAYFLFISQVPRFLIEAIVTGGLLLLVIVKLCMGSEPESIVPLLGMLALASFRLMPCANRIVNLTNSIKFFTPFFDTIYKELLEIRQNKDRSYEYFSEYGKSKLHFDKEIQVRDLEFYYSRDQKSLLNGISFTIPKGSFIGIIGQSGAGKTTFVDILLGLLKPTGGQTLVDGKDIFEDIRSWQANLSYVPQSIYLIDGTIKDNIAIGISDKEIDDIKLEKVLKMAELYDFVKSLPDGIYTKVGERGVRLSGGQRQRIGIARALYCEPMVLILDEATSALDSETERSITNTILKLKGEITIIAVAHRISTLVECDFKIEFKDGNITIIR